MLINSIEDISYLELTEDMSTLIAYLQHKKLLPESRICTCGKELTKLEVFNKKNRGTSQLYFRCKCLGQPRISINKNTLFDSVKLSYVKALKLLWYIATFDKNDIIELKENCDVNKTTAFEWYLFARELMLNSLSQVQIGGVGVTVEIDDQFFARNKFWRGRTNKDGYIFAGVERTSKECFLAPVDERTAESLCDTVRNNILPGSTVVSSCWKTFDVWNHEGYHIVAVTNSLQFKDCHPKDNNTIEDLWNLAKENLPRLGPLMKYLPLYFAEFLWKRQRGLKRSDRFEELLRLIALQYPC